MWCCGVSPVLGLSGDKQGVSDILCVSRCLVSSADDKSISEVNGKLGFGFMPGNGWPDPFVLNIS